MMNRWSRYMYTCAQMDLKNEYNDYHNNMYADIMMEFLWASANESHKELYHYIAEIKKNQKNMPIETPRLYALFLEFLGKT